jgi:pantoate--beta-alanine ligase
VSLQSIESAAAMQQQALAWRAEGKRIGFVPTMGYLHDGHLSLMQLIRPRCDRLVTSIFVNPMQFGPKEDLAQYPRDLQRDVRLCESVACDAVFSPSVEEMYPKNFHTYIEVEYLTETLCGPWRPGHFRGVTTVVCKLFNIVQPQVAAFGQKDAQQVVVIERMVQDLNMPIEIVIGPTRREPDGLAMSSRNVYLSPIERRQATALYHALKLAENMIADGDRDPLKISLLMKSLIMREANSPAIEYVAIVDRETLHPVRTIAGHVIIALAVRIGRTRLIDNFMLEVQPAKNLLTIPLPQNSLTGR